MLATVLDPRRSQDAPRRLQDGHKMHQVVSKIPQDAPRRSKTPPRRPQDRVPDGPTSVFGRNYGYIFRNFQESYLVAFLFSIAFWMPFGVHLGLIPFPNLPPIVQRVVLCALWCVVLCCLLRCVLRCVVLCVALH